MQGLAERGFPTWSHRIQQALWIHSVENFELQEESDGQYTYLQLERNHLKHCPMDHIWIKQLAAGRIVIRKCRPQKVEVFKRDMRVTVAIDQHRSETYTETLNGVMIDNGRLLWRYGHR